jgi:hypothetical protein
MAARRLDPIVTLEGELADMDLAPDGRTPLRLTASHLQGVAGILRRGAAGFDALTRRRPEFVYVRGDGLTSPGGCFSNRGVTWDGGDRLRVQSRATPEQWTTFLLDDTLIQRLVARQTEIRHWVCVFERWETLDGPDVFVSWGLEWIPEWTGFTQFTQYDWCYSWGPGLPRLFL